jgi:hypothetical protein
MDPASSSADAVVVLDGRITAAGSFEELRRESVVVDDTFGDAVICTGLIDQHLHPVLGATTLMTDVIATEDWALPDRVCPAARSADVAFRCRFIPICDGTGRPAHARVVRGQPANAERPGGLPRTACARS